MNLRLLLLAALVAPLPARAQPPTPFAPHTPWIGDAGAGSVSIAFERRTADDFFRAEDIPEERGAIPGGGAELSQNTGWLGIRYAISDAVSLDLRSGWGRSSLPGRLDETFAESFSDLVDTHLGATWRVADERKTGMPSVALRAGVIVAGRYPSGFVNSLGDGGHGFEASALVGQFVERVGFSAEAGYRARTGDIPSDVFVNLAGFLQLGDRATLAADYRIVNGNESGLDIGDFEFASHRFPELQEDIHFAGGRLDVEITDAIGIEAFFGQVVHGRNTPASWSFGGGVVWSFGPR